MDSRKPGQLPESPGEGGSPRSNPPRRGGRWWLALLILVVAGIAIWHFRTARASSQAQNSAQSGRGRGGAQSVPVVVATAQKGDLPVFLKGLGSATAFNTVTVRSRVDGQLLSVAFQEGQFVKAGELLAEIDPRPFQVQQEQAEGQLARDTAQLHDAQVNYQRYQALYQAQVIPKQQLDTQLAQVEQFQGALKADQAQIDNAKLQLTYCRITAPITGRIGLRLVDAGNIVHANDPNGLVVITQLQPIAVLFSLPQEQLPAVYQKLRSGARLPVEAFDQSDSAKIAEGRLLTIDNQIDPNTGTYKLKAVFENENNTLFPNQFVNVHLLVDVKRDLILIPAAAIQRGPQGTYVYAVSEGNTAKIQMLSIALTAGSTVGISSGLTPGQSVVIDGQDKLQDGSKVEPRTAGSTGPQAGGQRQ